MLHAVQREVVIENNSSIEILILSFYFTYMYIYNVQCNIHCHVWSVRGRKPKHINWAIR